MQYRHGVGHAPAKLALRSEGLYQSKAFAPMQYRHGIGHAPANFAFAADTKRKTSVPLFFASTGGLRLPSSMPILHQSLQFIDCYSPSLRRFSQVSGSDCSLTDLLYISRFILLVFTVLRFASLLVPAGSDCLLSCLYCISRFTLLIVTVLLSAGFRKYRVQIVPSLRPIG